MSMMVCQEVSKSYGKNSVMSQINLTLESGKIYGLIGRNGAGKTTLLSMMANHVPVTGGMITLDGENIWENPKALKRICFARELNISAENGLGCYTVKKYLKTASIFFAGWDQTMADSLVEKFGLDPKKKLSKLSKGMLSMVTIIVAMASKAEFTFLDEPVAGLDAIAREQFYQFLLEEYEKTGRTFVVSSHIIDEISDVIETVIILNQGQILLNENTQHLLDRTVYVSGLAADVDRATSGLEVHHPETLGRSKAVTVLMKEGAHLCENNSVTVQPVSLEKLFIALCGEDKK